MLKTVVLTLLHTPSLLLLLHLHLICHDPLFDLFHRSVQLDLLFLILLFELSFSQVSMLLLVLLLQVKALTTLVLIETFPFNFVLFLSSGVLVVKELRYV